MKPELVTAILSAVVVGAGTVWYIRLVVKRFVKPLIASWIVSTLSMVLSLFTYWTSPNANFVGGFLNGISFFTIFGILLPAWIVAKRDGGKIVFPPFQQGCLWASAGITVLWVIIMLHGGTGFIPNLLVQGLLVISYSMMINKYWNAYTHEESLVLWWSVFGASCLGFATAHLKHDLLAYAYAVRSIIMCAILLFALHRADWRRKTMIEVAEGMHRQVPA